MVTLGVMYATIEIAPLNTRTIDVEQANQCGNSLRRSYMLGCDTLNC